MAQASGGTVLKIDTMAITVTNGMQRFYFAAAFEQQSDIVLSDDAQLTIVVTIVVIIIVTGVITIQRKSFHRVTAAVAPGGPGKQYFSAFTVGVNDFFIFNQQTCEIKRRPSRAQADVLAVAGAVSSIPNERQWSRQFEVRLFQQFFAADHTDGATARADLEVGWAGFTIA